MLHRPRNRQHHGQHNQIANSRQSHNQTPQNSSHRGRGGRGSSLPQRIHSARSDLPRVPNTHQVVPGAGVSIVLKADQRTGREVQGVVQDVLTRGDHPRGIKVRLRDGRVGRVQQMSDGVQAQSPLSTRAESGSRVGEGDKRIAEADRHLIPDRLKLNLGDALETFDEREPDGVEDTEGPVSVCPVCGSFRGDEAAVAHHVGTHFE